MFVCLFSRCIAWAGELIGRCTGLSIRREMRETSRRYYLSYQTRFRTSSFIILRPLPDVICYSTRCACGRLSCILSGPLTGGTPDQNPEEGRRRAKPRGFGDGRSPVVLFAVDLYFMCYSFSHCYVFYSLLLYLSLSIYIYIYVYTYVYIYTYIYIHTLFHVFVYYYLIYCIVTFVLFAVDRVLHVFSLIGFLFVLLFVYV